MKKNNNAALGFTLIEVLIALAVFSSVISLVMFGLDQGRLQWSKSTERANTYQELQLRKQWLSQLFNQANASMFKQGYGSETAFFYGDQKRVKFLSNAPIIDGPGSYATVELTVEEKDNQKALLFQQWAYTDPYLTQTAEAQSSQSLVLLDNISDVQWQYYLSARTEPTSMEIRFGGFRSRPEGFWSDQPYDADYEQVIPPMVRLSFRWQGSAYQWQFYLPMKSEAYNQGDSLEVK
ncbi:type II secretion system protein J [Salinivibrio sp. ES.052]|uniref:PulJ/GspJ family protein n=1 Tax=Salinivibrio sp. ES.052 TaxID=1882823 RepID=UPI0009276FA4|nr:prepilin-type N-terminal cleavage/methylation domain-containing protein [Salinivibrio sp. ES.052]SIN79534.1 prepilin-type N-terminal cleavage/methylation domain-containing protein [Salinivibrio sp. ES.052]